jgi:protein AbiQ
MNNLQMYRVKTEYIHYLKKFQDHIWDNKENGRLRPYIGIVIQIEDYNYFAPLSSSKDKHKIMKENLSFIKIEYKGELKCVINLNNIIPVDKNDLIEFDINQEEKAYSDLLNIEIQEIRKKQNKIINNVKVVYIKTTKFRNEKQNQWLNNICYNFKLLETKMDEYITQKEAATISEE